MSLFNETVQRAARAEQALDAAQKEIAGIKNLNKNLEIALKAALHDKQMQPSSSHKWNGTEPKAQQSKNYNALNELSDDEVLAQFKAREYHAEQDRKSRSLRSRLLTPIAALFKSRP